MTTRSGLFAGFVSLAMVAFACGDPQTAKRSPTPSTVATREPTPLYATATLVATETAPPAPPTSATDTPEPIASPRPATERPLLTPAPSPFAGRTRVTDDFTTATRDPWYHYSSAGGATVSNGILTLDTPADASNEMILHQTAYFGHPIPADDAWDLAVSSARGWWVEVRMRVDPLTDDVCVSDAARGPSLTLWATDETFMAVKLGFSSKCVALILSYNTAIKIPMDTTAAFHVYRISTRERHVTVMIDGVVAIDHHYPEKFDQTEPGLFYGDGQGGYGPTRSYWDYITYDVSGPNP